MAYRFNPATGKFDLEQTVQSIIWLNRVGEGVPSDDVGQDDDFYLDSLTLNLYRKENGTWV